MLSRLFKVVLISIAILMMAGVAEAQLMDSAWAKFHRNIENTGQSPYSSSSDGTLKWNYTTGSWIESSPAIASDGTIYIGSGDGKLYAINSDGTLKWSYTTGDWIEQSSPAIASDGTIYIGSGDGKLYAINSDGTLKWNYTVGYWIESSPAISSDGTIYVGSDASKLHAVYSNGTPKWNYTTGDWIESSPAISSDGTIYVGSLDGKLYAIFSNGTLKWNYTTGSWIISSPSIASDGTIYVGSGDNKLYALYPNGTLRWNYTTGGGIESSPAIASDGTIYIGSGDGKLYAINPNGTLKWNYTMGNWVDSSPAIASDGTIYVGSKDNKSYAINSDGTLRWSYTTGDWVYSSPAIASDGTVYVGSGDGKLYAFQSSETYRFSGYVRDPGSNDIQDATVTLWNVSYSVVAVTNPSGFWNLSGQLSDGYYDILIQKSGYADAQGYLQFTSGGVLLNTTLYNVNINGTVYDASSGSVLSSVNISLFQNDYYANGTGRYFNTTSDANGTYTLNGFLANKRIDVNATKASYTHYDFNVTPLQAGNYIMNLYLVPVCSGGNVCGLVLSWPWYQAIPGATVNLWNATYSNTTTTNDWGYYVFT